MDAHLITYVDLFRKTCPIVSTVSSVTVLEQKAIAKQLASDVLLPPHPQSHSCHVDPTCSSKLPLYPAVDYVIVLVMLSP